MQQPNIIEYWTEKATTEGTLRKMLHFPPNYFFLQPKEKEKGL